VISSHQLAEPETFRLDLDVFVDIHAAAVDEVVHGRTRERTNLTVIGGGGEFHRNEVRGGSFGLSHYFVEGGAHSSFPLSW